MKAKRKVKRILMDAFILILYFVCMRLVHSFHLSSSLSKRSKPTTRASTASAKGIVWVRVLRGFCFIKDNDVVLRVDNDGFIALGESPLLLSSSIPTAPYASLSSLNTQASAYSVLLIR